MKGHLIMATQLDAQDELDRFARSDDLFEALSYALACSRSVHQQLHTLEELDPPQPAPSPDICCARTIEGTALILSIVLDDLVEMVDKTRRAGRPWTTLSVQQKGEALRDVFKRASPLTATDFEDISTVWWEPFELSAYGATPPVGGCPARVAPPEHEDLAR
jgi:hypothetical protein